MTNDSFSWMCCNKRRKISPTIRMYEQLQRAFDHFNEHLFDGALPDCLITLRARRNISGYYYCDRFVNPEGQFIDELAMNPSYFSTRSVEEVLSFLVHEMTHQWQARFGTLTPGRMHNKEWADKMFSIGLKASTTGTPRGKEIGQNVLHYIWPSGKFMAVTKRFLEQTDFKLEWIDREPPPGVDLIDGRQWVFRSAGIHLNLTDPPIKTLSQLFEEDSLWIK